MSAALGTGPGYFASAWAGVAPFSTASVRAISTLVWRGIARVLAADAAVPASLEDLLNSFEFAPRKMKSSSRSSPPVERRLPNRSAALVENGLAAAPRSRRRPSNGCSDASAGPDAFAVAPRLLKYEDEL